MWGGTAQDLSRCGGFVEGHSATSPRLRGEVEIRGSEFRVRGSHRARSPWRQPLTPTLSP